MMTFAEWLKASRNEELPSGTINGSWFAERGLPMVVECTCCGMTMAVTSAMINDDGQIYCASCTEE